MIEAFWSSLVTQFGAVNYAQMILDGIVIGLIAKFFVDRSLERMRAGLTLQIRMATELTAGAKPLFLRMLDAIDGIQDAFLEVVKTNDDTLPKMIEDQGGRIAGHLDDLHEAIRADPFVVDPRIERAIRSMEFAVRNWLNDLRDVQRQLRDDPTLLGRSPSRYAVGRAEQRVLASATRAIFVIRKRGIPELKRSHLKSRNTLGVGFSTRLWYYIYAQRLIAKLGPLEILYYRVSIWTSDKLGRQDWVQALLQGMEKSVILNAALRYGIRIAKYQARANVDVERVVLDRIGNGDDSKPSDLPGST